MTWNPFEKALRDCLAADSELIVIHSSMIHLLGAQAPDKWMFLSALRSLVDEGKTLALPAFTFSFCRGTAYHAKGSPSETGILADWAMTLGGARRTRHPIYSFVTIGPQAGMLASVNNSTTFGADSIFAEFERQKAILVMLGCGWEYCTQFHFYEEGAGVPYRYFKTFSGSADYGEGPGTVEAKMFVRDLGLGPVNDFSSAVAQMRKTGHITSVPFMGGNIESVSCSIIGETCRAQLAEDLWCYVQEPIRKAWELQNRIQAEKAPALKIALLGHSNLHFLQEALSAEWASLVLNQRVEIYCPPFGQLVQQILIPNSPLMGFAAEVSFFVDRLEDLLGMSSLEGVDPEIARNKVIQYGNAISDYARQAGGRIFVLDFASLDRSGLGFAEGNEEKSPVKLTRSLSGQLRMILEGAPGVRFIDFLYEAARFEEGPILDSRLWFLGRFPYSEGFSRHLAKRFSALVLAATGRTSRLLLVDLDNTLWGGVLGEDGIAGVQLGGDFPGNAFKEFQKAISSLAGRGMALAICSKNDQEHALNAMATLPDMILRPSILAAHRINWGPKWKNAVDLCAELSLAPDSALFIDDNPVEREQMRQHCPGIKVLDLPADPALYVKALLETPYLECLELTPEDFKRGEGYRLRSQWTEAKIQFADSTAFFSSLGLQLFLNPLSNENMQRAEQLSQKTNQFNTTTRRRSRTQLQAWKQDGGEVIVVGVEDKFSSYENVGLLMVKQDEPSLLIVHSYLLSCRVLGKGLETAILHWLKRYAKASGCSGIKGQIVQTERNSPVRTVYQDAGYDALGDGWWGLSIDPFQDAVPGWVKIVDHVSDKGAE